MGVDAIITIGVILIAFGLFATEYFSVDQVALGIMVVLGMTGVLSPGETLRGFANPATVTVAAMFVLSDALIRTGLIESVGPLFTKLLSRGYHKSVAVLTSLVGTISAFINNTPVVATFIPIVAHSTRKTGKHPSRYLIPLSFGAIFGGTCTLIGTSTNLLVDGIARDEGLSGFSMFLFAPLGLVFFLVGAAYLLLFARKLIPTRERLDDLEDRGDLKNYLAELEVIRRINDYEDGAEKSDESIRLDQIFEDTEVEQIKRSDVVYQDPEPDFVLEEGDTLLVRADFKHIKSVLKNDYLQLSERLSDRQFPTEATRVVEIVILPNSSVEGQTLADLDFFQRYQSRVLAIRQRGEEQFDDLASVKLRAGDVLLLQTNEKGYQLLYETERKGQTPFKSLSESGIRRVKTRNLLEVGGTIAAVILLASFHILPLVTAALGGIFLLVLRRHTSMEKAYRAIDWRVVILLAGALSLGTAMSKTGLSEWIADLIENRVAATMGPMAVVGALYLATSVLTETMSNNAAAALLAPVAISLAKSMEVDPIPLLLAITFAGSASFMTPIGYQTNTMVYSAGKYKFRDFIRVGLPLNLIFWLLATLLIPVFYPF